MGHQFEGDVVVASDACDMFKKVLNLGCNSIANAQVLGHAV
jgi:hypothetical protein